MVGFHHHLSLGSFWLLLLLVVVVRCELPPWVYDEWRETAENYVYIHVLNDTYTTENNKAGRDRDCYMVDYTVQAKILQVNRTTAPPLISLDEGDVITFSTWYRNNSMFGCRGFVGPSSPDLLVANWCGWAYLNSTTTRDSTSSENIPSTYTLAAGGYSFEEESTTAVCPVDNDDGGIEESVVAVKDPTVTTTNPIEQTQSGDESNIVTIPDEPTDEIIIGDAASGEATVPSDQGEDGGSSNGAEEAAAAAAATATATTKTTNSNDDNGDAAAAASLNSSIFLATSTTTVIVILISSLLPMFLVEY